MSVSSRIFSSGIRPSSHTASTWSALASLQNGCCLRVQHHRGVAKDVVARLDDLRVAAGVTVAVSSINWMPMPSMAADMTMSEVVIPGAQAGVVVGEKGFLVLPRVPVAGPPVEGACLSRLSCIDRCFAVGGQQGDSMVPKKNPRGGVSAFFFFFLSFFFLYLCQTKL